MNIVERYGSEIKQLLKNCSDRNVITAENVYQEGIIANRQIFDHIVDGIIKPGSGLHNKEHLKELFDLAQQGKSCLILMEHYTNFDLPCFLRLIDRDFSDDPKVSSESIVAIAGMKLSEDSPAVRAFTEAFTRIVIYPSRSLSNIEDPEVFANEKKRSNSINRASIHAMTRAKYHGKIILVFPSGTRYRPWKPETKKGVKEMDSYMKSFEYAVTISINGNCLRIDENEGLLDDHPQEDVILYGVSPVFKSRETRNRWRDAASEDGDKKQAVVDQIMEKLEIQHSQMEPIHQELRKKAGLKD